ncbi:MlaE family lipid ABC transporter permease subunit [Pelagibius marinus]|uniref:MlaE family lipid ABC transporter permease subunit n=1 Tax=Pelagibius marinus TaxID=2762760 RepID=UPI0029C9F0E8|nr:MlaE family lipid ABC transporter permease subunit [Pelagibius marinus]
MSAAEDLGLGSGPASALNQRREGETLRLEFAGQWTTQELARHDNALRALDLQGARLAVVDLSACSAIDSAGAWVLDRTLDDLKRRGAEVSLVGSSPAIETLLGTIAKKHVELPPPPRPDNPIIAVTLRLGRETVRIAREGTELLSFLGLTVTVFLRSLLMPWRIRLTPLIAHMEQTGLNALPIVGLISFLVGVVLAYQGADQLARFGAQIFTVNLVAIGVLREMGILLTAIIVAGRSGSSFTAQIGTMKVNEEVDAMQTLGLDPMEVLVMPRVFALVLVLPLLTFYADLMGLLGGAVMATVVLDISFFQFARQLSDAVTLWTFWIGIIKAPLFAFIIGMIGCYEGLKVSRSAESVGRQTTRAVVEAIFLVIVLDALLSIFFSVIGI